MLLLVTASLFFGLILLWVSIPLMLSIALLILIFLTTTYFVMHTALLSMPHSWQQIAINKAGECRLTQKNGVSFLVHIKPDSFVSESLTILHIAPTEVRWFEIWKHRYVLLQDNTEAESFRRLRVYLRWHKNTPENATNLAAQED